MLTLLALCSAFVLAPPVYTVRAIGLEPLAASNLELDIASRTLRLVLESGTREIPLADLIRIDVAGSASVFDADCDVLLADGSRFLARLADGVEDSLAIETPAFGRSAIALEHVRSVAFGDASLRPDPTRWPPLAEDSALRRGKGEGDKVVGTLTKIGRDGVDIASDIGAIHLKVTDLLGASIGVDPKDAAKASAVAGGIDVDLRDGGSLHAELLAMHAGAIAVKTVFSPTLDLPFSHVERIRFHSERFTWLSDLEPATVEEMPYLGGADDFIFHWRKDRSVTGEPLAVGGVRYGKGIGAHSRTRLTYALDGKFTSFEAAAGICDEVTALRVNGSVVVRVRVDDQPVFESPLLRGGDKAFPIPRVDLKGKKTLLVEFDFGDQGDAGDRAALVDPLLTRSP